jgi:type I restriction enzyme, R subunit
MSAQPKHTEARFEDAIEDALLARGYEKRAPGTYDATLGLFPADVIAYVKTSQGKKWQSLVDLQGKAAETVLVDALIKELGLKGALHILRHGFKCFGKTYQMAAFKPASGMNPDAIAAYGQNILTITRQIPFNPATTETIDVMLAVSGIPVVTAELKNPMSGQTVENAKHQCANDRDPRTATFRFKERSLVHFAVDPIWFSWRPRSRASPRSGFRSIGDTATAPGTRLAKTAITARPIYGRRFSPATASLISWPATSTYRWTNARFAHLRACALCGRKR